MTISSVYSRYLYNVKAPLSFGHYRHYTSVSYGKCGPKCQKSVTGLAVPFTVMSLGARKEMQICVSSDNPSFK